VRAAGDDLSRFGKGAANEHLVTVAVQHLDGLPLDDSPLGLWTTVSTSQRPFRPSISAVRGNQKLFADTCRGSIEGVPFCGPMAKIKRQAQSQV
jgi:hypothetical protein